MDAVTISPFKYLKISSLVLLMVYYSTPVWSQARVLECAASHNDEYEFVGLSQDDNTLQTVLFRHITTGNICECTPHCCDVVFLHLSRSDLITAVTEHKIRLYNVYKWEGDVCPSDFQPPS
jgi:hypothetical protein